MPYGKRWIPKDMPALAMWICHYCDADLRKVGLSVIQNVEMEQPLTFADDGQPDWEPFGESGDEYRMVEIRCRACGERVPVLQEGLLAEALDESLYTITATKLP